MATYRGLFTGNGSVGDITLTEWKGKKVMKQKVPANNTSNTAAQQGNRAKFALLAQLAGLLGNVIRVGFRTSATDKTEQNVFASKNYDLVTLDQDLVPDIDYTKMVLSAGNVEPMQITSATVPVGGNVISVDWANNSNGGSGLPTDLAAIAVIHRATNQVWSSIPGEGRSDGGTNMGVPGATQATAAQYQVYGFFKRVNGPAASPTTNRAAA